jgi:hypothetical protein
MFANIYLPTYFSTHSEEIAETETAARARVAKVNFILSERNGFFKLRKGFKEREYKEYKKMGC